VSGSLSSVCVCVCVSGEEAHQRLRHHSGHAHLLRGGHAGRSRDAQTHRAHRVQGEALGALEATPPFILGRHFAKQKDEIPVDVKSM